MAQDHETTSPEVFFPTRDRIVVGDRTAPLNELDGFILETFLGNPDIFISHYRIVHDTNRLMGIKDSTRGGNQLLDRLSKLLMRHGIILEFERVHLDFGIAYRISRLEPDERQINPTPYPPYQPPVEPEAKAAPWHYPARHERHAAYLREKQRQRGEDP